MKFLVIEYKAVKALIDASSLEYNDFAFVKKRGRLQMLHKGQLQVAFHRKTNTVLNDARQWEKQVEYTVYTETDQITTTNWDDVLNVFSRHISMLENN